MLDKIPEELHAHILELWKRTQTKENKRKPWWGLVQTVLADDEKMKEVSSETRDIVCRILLNMQGRRDRELLEQAIKRPPDNLFSQVK